MSSSGGGLVVLRQTQKVAMSTDLKGLTIINDSSSDLTLSQTDIDALAAQYCADPYIAVGLTWNGSAWSVTSGPSE